MYAAAFVLLTTLPVLAEEPKGPPLAPGKDLPGPFHPYNATGSSRGRFHCLVSEHGNDPTVLLFARGLEDNAAFKDLLKKLDGLITANPTARLRCFVVFLSDDLPKPAEDDDKRETAASRLERLGDGLGLKQVVLCLGAKAVAEKYHLEDGKALTAVLYRKLRIRSSKAVAADEVEGAVKELLTEAERLPRAGTASGPAS